MFSDITRQNPFLDAFYDDHRARAKFIAKWFYFRQEHALLYAPVLLGIGIAVYFLLNFEPKPSSIFMAWCGALAFLIISIQLYVINPNRRYVLILGYIIAMIVSGLFLAQDRAISVHTPMLQKELKFANVEGRVLEVDIMPTKNTKRLLLGSLYIEELETDKTPFSIRVKVRGEQDYKPGDRVKFLASLNPPSGPVAPEAFDFQRQSYFKKLGAVGFAYYTPKIIESATEGSFSDFWEDMRLNVIAYIKDVLPVTMQGVSITFMTGEKSSIAQDDLQAMRDSGLAHLLAISGLHVGLVAGFVFFFIRLGLASIPSIALNYPIKKWAAGAALIGAFVYMFLVGASVPTQRAMMMTGIALFAIMIDRSPFSLRMVALAALIILISYPEALVSASFQMSFAAVTGLVAFYDYFRPQLQGLYREAGVIRKVALYILGIAVTTIIAGTSTALFGIYHFQAWSLYSTLANILAMPVVGMIVMPAAVLSYVLMPFGLADIPINLMGRGIEWVLMIAHYVANLDGAVIKIPALSYQHFISLTLCALFVIIGPAFIRLIGALGLLIVMIHIVLIPPSDILLISERNNLIGYYDHTEKTFYVSNKKKERYVRENWTRRLGIENDQVKKLSEHHKGHCDHNGCRMSLDNIKIALSYNDYALKNDCLWADMIITDRYAPYSCRAEIKLDRGQKIKNGATEIKFQEGAYHMKTVSDLRGERYWTQ